MKMLIIYPFNFSNISDNIFATKLLKF